MSKTSSGRESPIPSGTYAFSSCRASCVHLIEDKAASKGEGPVLGWTGGRTKGFRGTTAGLGGGLIGGLLKVGSTLATFGAGGGGGVGSLSRFPKTANCG